MAHAAEGTIVEAEEIVEIAEEPPESIHLPGVNVNRVFRGQQLHRTEILKIAKDDSADGTETIRDMIAKRAAKEFAPGSTCTLGVGMPTLASAYAAKDRKHGFVQSENGVIGVGECPKKGQEHSNWIDADRETVSPIPGVSTFGSDISFGQIGRGYLDLTVLGALECSQYGDIASHLIPGKPARGMRGAIDLVANSQETEFWSYSRTMTSIASSRSRRGVTSL